LLDVLHLRELSLFDQQKLLGQVFSELLDYLLTTHLDHLLALFVDVRRYEIIVVASRYFDLDSLDTVTADEAHLSSFSLSVLDRRRPG